LGRKRVKGGKKPCRGVIYSALGEVKRGEAAGRGVAASEPRVLW